MTFISAIKQMGIRVWDSNNRSLGTIFGCLGGFAVGLTVVLSHHADLPILGIPDTIAYEIIAVCLATGIGGNLSSYIGATIDILTNEKTLFDLIEYSLVHWGCMQKRQPPAQAPETAPAESHKQHFPFITSNIPKEGIAQERRSIELERVRASVHESPNNMVRNIIEKLAEINSKLQRLNSKIQPLSSESKQPRLSLAILEPVEYTPDAIIQMLEKLNEELQKVESGQAHLQEISAALQDENKKLKEALRETQAKNGQLAESIMQHNHTDNKSRTSPIISPSHHN